LELYAAGLAPEDTRHRDLVAAILEDLVADRAGLSMIAAPL
jgi:hypothetical protein